MSRVIAERDRLAVLATQTALSAQDQILRSAKLSRIPTHAGRLSQSEHDAARLVEQHFLSDRQSSNGAMPVGDDVEEAGVGGVEQVGNGGHREIVLSVHKGWRKRSGRNATGLPQI